MSATVPGRDLVVNLGAIVRPAELADTTVALSDQLTLRAPCSDVGVGSTASPQDRPLSALCGGLAPRITRSATDDGPVARVVRERHTARHARLGYFATSAPSRHPVALGRATADAHHPARHVERLAADLAGPFLSVLRSVRRESLSALSPRYHAPILPREAEYVAIAEARLNGTQRGLGLDVPAPVRPWKDYPTATRRETWDVDAPEVRR